ncbi:MAG: glycosyltransferase family 2 protein [Lachnospiraceae bacterium]|nr:glycosyltransferase family 2 protein [Lachnospiraceae bacterium]
MISVVIPSYNRAGTIKRSVNSVLAQSVSDLEVIVVDDCSSDDTEKMVRSIRDDRVRYHRLEKNSGACVARNKGIELAWGDYIAFQDSDDIWMKNKLEVQLRALLESGADITFCSLLRHRPGGAGNAVIFPDVKEEKDRFVTHRELCARSWVSTQTILAKRHVFDGCMFDPLVKKGQDYDWCIRASRNHTVYFVRTPLVEQYLQNDSISMKGAASIVESRQYFLEKYKDEFAENSAFELYLLKQIAHNKVLCHMDPSKEYGEIWKMERTGHNLMCAALSRLHLIKFVVR